MRSLAYAGSAATPVDDSTTDGGFSPSGGYSPGGFASADSSPSSFAALEQDAVDAASLLPQTVPDERVEERRGDHRSTLRNGHICLRHAWEGQLREIVLGVHQRGREDGLVSARWD